MKYEKFRYYYPPRPENKISNDQLFKYEGDYLSQPKLNGSCCELYISPEGEVRNFGRHKNESLSNFTLSNKEAKKLNKTGKWMVLVGEYMNKNKKDENDKHWNHKFVIFDILVYNNEYLVGSTFKKRVKLLDEIFGTTEYNENLFKVSENIFRVKTFYSKFSKIWSRITKVDMIEGLVLKRINGKLERGLREKNNVLTQLKARKPTKNYHF